MNGDELETKQAEIEAAIKANGTTQQPELLLQLAKIKAMRGRVFGAGETLSDYKRLVSIPSEEGVIFEALFCVYLLEFDAAAEVLKNAMGAFPRPSYPRYLDYVLKRQTAACAGGVPSMMQFADVEREADAFVRAAV